MKCFLRCIAGSHSPIVLPNLQDIVLGRCPQTKITEKRCSKNQLTLRADLSNLSVNVRQSGPNLSAVNGVALGENRERVVRHGDTVHFLVGQFEHVVEFDPPPEPGSSKLKRKVDHQEHDIPKKSCQDFSSTASSSGSGKSKWESVANGKLLVFECEGSRSSTKIASYDMDGTIICTQSGKVFPTNPGDWKILWPEIPPKLQKLHADGYKIVIFTNQAGITRGKTTASEMQQKIEKVVASLGVPVQAFVSTSESIFRKPAPGMWHTLTNQRNGGRPIDMVESFYCGDAAGRPDKWAPKKKKDFSSSDRLFAVNLGLKFLTPEEHFLGQKPAPFNLPDFNPAVSPKADASLVDPPGACVTSSKQEIILLVGFPGSGKSFFCREHLVPAGYSHVNRDTLGSWQKCVSAAESALKAGKSVVVDNTNGDLESRSRYTQLASKFKISCRCFIIGESIARARHNNKFRELTGEVHEPISEMIMNSYKSKYKEPHLDEGYQEIIRINFKPTFSKQEHEDLYKMYLLDKY